MKGWFLHLLRIESILEVKLHLSQREAAEGILRSGHNTASAHHDIYSKNMLYWDVLFHYIRFKELKFRMLVNNNAQSHVVTSALIVTDTLN